MRKLILILSFILGTWCGLQAQVWRKSELPKFRHASGICMLNPKNVLAVGGWESNDSITGIFQSGDSAYHWNLISDLPGNFLNAILVIDEQHLWACGRYGSLFFSDDAGLNWQDKSISSFKSYALNCLMADGNNLIIGGGILNSDSGLIIQSSDGGVTWKMIYSGNRGIIKSMALSGMGDYFAVGSRGLTIKSSQNGSQWTVLPSDQDLSGIEINAIKKWPDDEMLLAGGRGGNDSLRFVGRIHPSADSLKTISLSAGCRLNALFVFQDGRGYVAGDYGNIFQLDSGAKVWKPLHLSPSINDDRAITSIHFVNRYYGVFGGRTGKTLCFIDTSLQRPEAQLETPTLLSNDQIQIRAIISVFGVPTQVSLDLHSDYGDSTFTWGIHKDNSQIVLTADLVLREGYYTAKVKLSGDAGVFFSEPLDFFVGPNEVPNFDFEYWQTKNLELISDWGYAGRVEVLHLHDGNTEVQLQAKDKQEPGALYYAIPGDNGLFGGISYSGRPDKIGFRGRFTTSPGDSVLVIYELKDANGASVAEGHQGFAGQLSQNADFSVNLNYLNANQVDTLKLIFVSSNYYSGSFDSSSVFVLDTMWFEGSAEQVPNQGLSKTMADTLFHPDSWYSFNTDGQLFQVRRSESKISGRYSLLLRDHPQFGRIGIATVNDNQYPYKPSFPVSFPYKRLLGYYTFDKQLDGDTLSVQIAMFKDGQQVGWGNWETTESVANWGEFEVDINYLPNQQVDSASIFISIRNQSNFFNSGTSEAGIDFLSFEVKREAHFPSYVFATNPININPYPNPSKGKFFLNIDRETLESCSLYSITGEKIDILIGKLGERTEVQANHPLSSGMYILRLKHSGTWETYKLNIEP
ncbi:MAG: T9SS type A sorting domain-containing protein [Bacteroidetes bacterium]|nr:T9SS type A sorting domain-containing protein [Bacteroidota bacterium]